MKPRVQPHSQALEASAAAPGLCLAGLGGHRRRSSRNEAGSLGAGAAATGEFADREPRVARPSSNRLCHSSCLFLITAAEKACLQAADFEIINIDMNATEVAKAASAKLAQLNADYMKSVERLKVRGIDFDALTVDTAELILVVDSAERLMGVESAERIAEIESAELLPLPQLASAEVETVTPAIWRYLERGPDEEWAAVVNSAELKVALGSVESLASAEPLSP